MPNWLAGPLVFVMLLYRRARYGYPFRRIPLTQGKYAIVDPEDFERLNKHKWYAARHGKIYYAQRTLWRKNEKTTTIAMHRLVIKVPEGMVADHINHNGLDNRKANLRPATPAQNIYNRPIAKKQNARSRFRGVTWCRAKKKWLALIRINGRNKFLGYFHDEKQAAKAYDSAAKKHHGDFAVPNFK